MNHCSAFGNRRTYVDSRRWRVAHAPGSQRPARRVGDVRESRPLVTKIDHLCGRKWYVHQTEDAARRTCGVSGHCRDGMRDAARI